MPRPLGVRFLSLPPGTGYGDAAAAYRDCLLAAGVPVSWIPLEWGTGTWGWEHLLAPRPNGDDALSPSPLHDTLVVHCTPIWHERWSASPGAERRVAFTTWEADRLPPLWVDILNRYDQIIVPSTHDAKVFRRSGVAPPVESVPHIARPVAAIRGETFAAIGERFLFYTIGTWGTRKAMPEVVRAFLDAFTDTDDVALVIKTNPEDEVALERARRGRETDPSRYAGTSWWTLARLLAAYPSAPPIHLVTREVPRSVIDELHTRGDCFLSLSRGEGWCLPAFEAAGCGNPVIITGWGGHLDYLPAGYPYLVDYELVPTTEDEPDAWFPSAPDLCWARADLRHASRLLRHIYELRLEARAWGESLRTSIAQRFDCRSILPGFVAALTGSS